MRGREGREGGYVSEADATGEESLDTWGRRDGGLGVEEGASSELASHTPA